MGEIRRCLMIDDDEDDHELFKMCLKTISKDISCMGVFDGQQAIDLLMSNTGFVPHYIFLDVNMPKMNGIECLRLLRKLPNLRNTKIFMYSTTSEKSVLEESKKLGAKDYIVKPTKTAELKEKLSHIFETGPEIGK
ncbi:response regulator [Algoriphagus sp. D3-2-R+10]|uniref:response regulator n=1 Tax=Algoriphagus aurantiacus TaxID=3103948 RepID=UPI002B3B70EE|nr:response regulator [Algoriphagus sp. D3-2-R+10]MEB2778524.1 response regulator [Algoriphagus sp. D3-2-R+10]